MLVQPLQTKTIRAGETSLIELLDEYVTEFKEESILVITSKIVSLCENRVVPLKNQDKEALIKQESSYYLPGTLSKYGHRFSIVNNTLIGAAGIDESNGDDNYILWPVDPQRTANEVRSYLADRFNLKQVGVIITDSASVPLRYGSTGICMSHSGFVGLHNYVGQPDLFNRPFSVSQANIAGGLASSAVVAMGEGSERLPLAVISDAPFVEFQDRNPSAKELSALVVKPEEDLFAVFFERVDWIKGDK